MQSGIKYFANFPNRLKPERGKSALELLGNCLEPFGYFVKHQVFDSPSTFERVESRQERLGSLHNATRSFCLLLVLEAFECVHIIGLGPLPAVHVLLFLLASLGKLGTQLCYFSFSLLLDLFIVSRDLNVFVFMHISTMPETARTVKYVKAPPIGGACSRTARARVLFLDDVGAIYPVHPRLKKAECENSHQKAKGQQA